MVGYVVSGVTSVNLVTDCGHFVFAHYLEKASGCQWYYWLGHCINYCVSIFQNINGGHFPFNGSRTD